MNEEELKKRREYLREGETDGDFLNWCDKVDLYEKGFQKGKLEEREKFENVINERIKYHEQEFLRYEKERKYAKSKKNFSQEQYSDDRARQEIRILDELNELKIILEQLQKEIGEEKQDEINY